MLLFTRSLGVDLSQLKQLWWAFLLVVLGFGVQIGLADQLHAIRMRANHLLTGTSGSVSGVSMLACCAHHVTELPLFFGFSGLGIFLVRFQIPLLLIGAAINWGAAIYYYEQIRHTS